MKRVFAATAMMVMVASLAGPAAAQQRGGTMSQGNHKDPLQLQYEREKRDQVENERAYDEYMKRNKTGAPTAKSDPWAGVRPNETNAKR
ncbi:MAG: hypothetical protein K2Z80_13770 [Xanthobacteraceae bacterium]|nr:hypothetical protein [Xanthobacteraceae bacterium]